MLVARELEAENEHAAAIRNGERFTVAEHKMPSAPVVLQHLI